MQEVSWRGSLKLVLEDEVVRPIVGGVGRWGVQSPELGRPVRNGDTSSTCPVVTRESRWLADLQACWGLGDRRRREVKARSQRAQSPVTWERKGKPDTGVGSKGMISGDSPGDSKLVSGH